MTSWKQIEANRRNALRSTGPASPEGKERSRGNAYRHGLTAETVIPSLEDAVDYEAFQAAVIADYDAESAVERELVLRLASLLWRLRRASGLETALFEMMVDTDGGACSAFRDDPGADPVAPGEFNGETRPSLAVGFVRLMELPTAALDRLSRYEYMLWRQARQILFSLQHIRLRQRQPHRSRPVRHLQFGVEGWPAD
jgi:hypothetical protein